jgi:hypothetical protein
MYVFGIILGALLLLVKYGSFYLLTGGEHQWRVPFTDEGIRDWTYRSSVRTGLLDLGAGYLGMHALVAFGGSIIAMVAMVTYMIVCMSIIFSGVLARKVKTVATNFWYGKDNVAKKKHKKQWEYIPPNKQVLSPALRVGNWEDVC